MTDAELFAACPVGSRWESRRSWPIVKVVRHTNTRDGRPSVVVESESPGRSRNAWHPAALLAKRTRVAS